MGALAGYSIDEGENAEKDWSTTACPKVLIGTKMDGEGDNMRFE